MPMTLSRTNAGVVEGGLSMIDDAHFEAIRRLIYREAGISLSDAKRALVCSRLGKRLRELHLADHGEYLVYLRNQDPRGEELQRMVNCLTTNKTDFLREPHHFAFLREVVFPGIERRAAHGGPRRVRIWSAGCSAGHEPYTIAMTIRDYFQSLRGWDVRVLASDINTNVLQTAARGIYPAEQLAPVPEESLRRHFLRGTGTSAGLYQARPELRQLIEFRQINFMDERWPFRTKFDVVFCRNVIIYFDTATQRKLTLRLAGQVAEGGYLMLGHSEHPSWLAEHLTPIRNTVYQRPARGDREAASDPQKVDCPRPPTVRKNMPPAASPDVPRRDVVAGEVLASSRPMELSTVLGSCVAACLFDPERQIGGMNHFMLPYHTHDPVASARYGVHAMEMLINEIMKLGGDRRRLQAKVFGASRVLQLRDSPWNVARRNAQFVRDFLATESIPIVAERLEDQVPLRVHYFTHLGKVFVRAIAKSQPLLKLEDRFSRNVTEQVIHPDNNNITLF